MKILVTAASKHGATTEIANAVGGALQRRGLEVTVAPAEPLDTVDGYDAYVLRSAVYEGHWLKPAIDPIEREGVGFPSKPAVLVTRRPIVDSPTPDKDPIGVTERHTTTVTRDHVLVAGKVDKSKLGFADHAIVIAFRAPFSDFQDWEEIGQWATGVANALAEASPPTV